MKFRIISSLFLELYLFSLCVLGVKAEVSIQSSYPPLSDRSPAANAVRSTASEPKLKPKFYKRGRHWTPKEEELLLKLRKQRMSWDEINKFFPERSWGAISLKHTKLTRDPSGTRPKRNRAWTDEEKELLLKLVGKKRDASWEEIAENLGTGRSVDSASYQYYKLTRGSRPAPKIHQEKWTADADDLLVEAAESGITFIDISHSLERSIQAVQIRIRMLERSNRLEPSPWGSRWYGAADFELVRELLAKGLSWKTIATQYFPGRPTSKHLRRVYRVYQEQKERGKGEKKE